MQEMEETNFVAVFYVDQRVGFFKINFKTVNNMKNNSLIKSN
jgi:hypothetical protein